MLVRLLLLGWAGPEVPLTLDDATILAWLQHSVGGVRTIAGGPPTSRQPHRVAYDQALVDELQELLAGEAGVTEQRMFGGLAFLLHGHMSVSVSRSGGLLVRVHPHDTDGYLALLPHVTLMEMGKRRMKGWLSVAPAGVTTHDELAAWVARSLAFVRTLPPK